MSEWRRPDSRDRTRLFIRLASGINDELRKELRYRGDLSRLFDGTLTTVDLYTVALLSSRPLARAKGTTASIDKRTIDRLRAAATFRKCSVNTSASSAIAAWLSR